MRWLSALLAAIALVGVAVNAKVEVKVHRQKVKPPTRCVPPSPCFPSRQVIAEFANNITGEVLQPSDIGYISLVTGDNGRTVSHPAIVVRAATESDVQKAVLFARKFYLMISVAYYSGDNDRGFAGDASLLINVAQLQSVSANVDVQTNEPGTLTAGSGSTWGQVYTEASNFNRDVVGGSWLNAEFPIGQKIQAGGFGPLSRSLGLAADSLLSARLVMMDGSIVDVSSAGATTYHPNGVSRRTTVDPGLWYAVRGGGVNSFGIPTSYTLQLHLRPSTQVTQVSLTYTLYRDGDFIGREPLKFLLPYVTALPNEWGGSVFINSAYSPNTVGEKGTFTLELLHYGVYDTDTNIAVETMTNYNPNNSRLSVSVVNRTSVNDYVRGIQYNLPAASRYYAFNTLLPEGVVTDSTNLNTLVDALMLLLNNPTVDSTYFCNMEPMGGAIPTANRTDYVTGAVRQASWSVACYLLWNDDNALRDEMMLPYAIGLADYYKSFGIGTALGASPVEDEEDWKETLYGGNYQQMLRTKLKYDIDNYLWCHNCVGSDFRKQCVGGCRGRRGRMGGDSDESDESDEDDSMERDDGMVVSMRFDD